MTSILESIQLDDRRERIRLRIIKWHYCRSPANCNVVLQECRQRNIAKSCTESHYIPLFSFIFIHTSLRKVTSDSFENFAKIRLFSKKAFFLKGNTRSCTRQKR